MADLLTSLITYHDFESDAGGVYSDSSAGGKDLTIVGATHGAGIFGNGPTFDGVNDALTRTNALSGGLQPGSGDFSVSIWGTGGAGTAQLILCGTAAGAGVLGWAIHKGGIDASEIFDIHDGVTRLDNEVTGAPWTGGLLKHIVAVVDRTAGFTRIYRGGVLISSKAIPGGFGSINNTNRFTIGASASDTAFWDGKADRFGAWGRVLTATEVQFLYNGGNGLSFSELRSRVGGNLIALGVL